MKATIIPSRLGWWVVIYQQADIILVKRFSHKRDAQRFLRQYNIRNIELSRKIRRVYYLLEKYFRGTKTTFDIDVQLVGISPFERRVLTTIRAIPYGCVTTYKHIAQKLQMKKGYQAVGRALKNNPIPIIFPCHRVIRSDGDIGGFSMMGGVDMKRRLLCLEGVDLAQWEKYLWRG